MLVFMGGVLSQLTSGLWIEHFGFIAPSWLVLTCHVASGLWVIFMVPENHERVTNIKHKFFDLKNLKTLGNVFKKARPDGARKCLLFLVIAGAILTLTVQGLGGVTALFVMRSPLCFGPKLVGYLLAYRMFLCGFGGAVGVKLFRTFFSEKVTAAIGIVSQIAEMGLFAFADRTWLVFTAPALGFFKGSVTPVLVGIMSRIVGENEQGSLFCAYGILNVFSQFLGAMLFNNVYEATLGLEFNGFVFMICAALKLVPFGILSCLHVTPPGEREEEMRIENDEEDVSKQEKALIKNEKNSDDNENGNDKATLETSANPELIELIKMTDS